MPKKTTDILVWAGINPNKRGSFEDFMLLLSKRAGLEGITTKFVFGNDIEHQFKKEGIAYIAAEMPKLASPIFLCRIIRELRPCCIHFHFVNCISQLPWLSKKLGVKHIIYTDHCSGIPRVRERETIEKLKRVRKKIYLKRIDYIVGVSDYVAARYQSPTYEAGRVWRIYNGVDLKRFGPVDEQAKNVLKKEVLCLRNSQTVITFAGQFIIHKGILPYTEAVNKLLNSRKDLFFVFIGAGPLYNETMCKFKQCDAAKIKFCGMLGDVKSIFQASDIVVMPSIWEEAFGLVAAEASACGVPVVGSNIGGLPEVIIDNISGILTPPGDVGLLIEAIKRLVNEPELRKKMGIQGRMHVEKYFLMEERVDQLIKLYKQCLRQGG